MTDPAAPPQPVLPLDGLDAPRAEEPVRASAPRVVHRPAPKLGTPCAHCGRTDVALFRRGVCRSCHRKLTDGGLEQLPDLRSSRALQWLSRKDYLRAWRATLSPSADRLLCEVFAEPLARPTDALSLITAPDGRTEDPNP